MDLKGFIIDFSVESKSKRGRPSKIGVKEKSDRSSSRESEADFTSKGRTKVETRVGRSTRGKRSTVKDNIVEKVEMKPPAAPRRGRSPKSIPEKELKKEKENEASDVSINVEKPVKRDSRSRSGRQNATDNNIDKVKEESASKGRGRKTKEEVTDNHSKRQTRDGSKDDNKETIDDKIDKSDNKTTKIRGGRVARGKKGKQTSEEKAEGDSEVVEEAAISSRTSRARKGKQAAEEKEDVDEGDSEELKEVIVSSRTSRGRGKASKTLDNKAADSEGIYQIW